MPLPELWIVAGPNGAGKTSCVQRRPISAIFARPPQFLNPDDRTKSRLIQAGYAGFADAPREFLEASFKAAADEVYSELCSMVDRRIPVGVETVLSTDEYQSLIDRVRDEGGFVGLIYITLSSSELAVERVACRVRQGGHDVPEAKIHERWRKSLEKLPVFAQRVTAFWVIDNSTSAAENVPLMTAYGDHGRLKFLHKNCFPELRTSLQQIPT